MTEEVQVYAVPSSAPRTMPAPKSQALTLYSLATAFAQDAAALAELDLDDATLSDTLAGLGGDLETKAQNTAMLARNLEALAEQIKAAEQEMIKRRKALENRAARIRAYILDSMQAGNIQKISCPYFVLSRRKNPDHVVIDRADAVPADYWRIPEPPPIEIDKAAIKTAIKAGTEVPGAHLESIERLEIK